MRFSNRAAFGWIETPAPISLRTSACSNTVALRPLARSASAAVRPPIPPPTIAMRSEPGISLRPLLLAAITGPCEVAKRLRLSAGILGRCAKRRYAKRNGQAGDDMPEHDPVPAECIDRTNPA